LPWTFWDFVELSGANPFAKWRDGIEDESARSAIETRIGDMESLEKWQEKWASNYEGREKIIELRITWRKVQYRPLGMYWPHRRRHFVLLGGGIEKGKIPPSVLDAVERRRKDFLANTKQVVPHE
jgi:putative component of toxin-antitoxin plasmid stabilization module